MITYFLIPLQKDSSVWKITLKLTTIHPLLVQALEVCLQSGEVPEWMVTGRTVLIQKDKNKVIEVWNYRLMGGAQLSDISLVRHFTSPTKCVFRTNESIF